MKSQLRRNRNVLVVGFQFALWILKTKTSIFVLGRRVKIYRRLVRKTFDYVAKFTEQRLPLIAQHNHWPTISYACLKFRSDLNLNMHSEHTTRPMHFQSIPPCSSYPFPSYDPIFKAKHSQTFHSICLIVISRFQISLLLS